MSMYDARGFVPADFDRDGDVDFFVCNNNQPYVFLRNETGASRNWLTVQLRGRADNSFGIGAKVRVVVEDGNGVPKTQMRQIHVGSGYLSSPPPEAHFGLGSHTGTVQVVVTWPNGQVQTVDGVATGRLVTIDQEDGLQEVGLIGPQAPTGEQPPQ